MRARWAAQHDDSLCLENVAKALTADLRKRNDIMKVKSVQSMYFFAILIGSMSNRMKQRCSFSIRVSMLLPLASTYDVVVVDVDAWVD